MINLMIKAVAALPPLKKEKKPGVAALVGFLLGGLGLGFYFRSVVDFLLPVVAVVVITATSSMLGSALASVGWLGGAAIAGVYGFYRAQDSNRRLSEASTRVTGDSVYQTTVS